MEKVIVTAKSLMEKIYQGIAENNCEIVVRSISGKRATANDLIKPLSDYLKRKGIEVK